MINHRYVGPIEAGVVRTPSIDTVAMGHVITGICAGIRRNRRLSLAAWNNNAEDPVDNLYAATIADLTILAVGVGGYDVSELKFIATDPIKHVFEASNFDGLIKLVTSLQNRTCTTPVTVDIDFHEDANETVISAFVSPNKPRYFVVPSERFKGLKNLFIEVQYTTLCQF
ncbi:hypothetical protein QZH41_012746 [Actinostola sp. cb2023]|nr:hypothetical protein QZH41_012746 [Actinostola sp. cb2023]